MSDSEGSTVLLQVDESANDVVHSSEDGVFAWLRPISETACAAFSASVNSVLKYDRKHRHHRRFLHVDDRQERCRSPFSEEGSDTQPKRLEWLGAFKLSLQADLLDPAQGWYLGTDRGQKSPQVDILLAPPTKAWASQRIASKHARLFFHQESGRIMLEARHTVISSRTRTEILNKTKTCVIEHGGMLQFGTCSYIFEYTDLHSTDSFQRHLQQFMRNHHDPQWSLNRHLTPSSVGIAVPVGKYWCSATALAQGTFGKITAGWTHEGRPVAVKTLKDPREGEVRIHQMIMKHIGHHVRVWQTNLYTHIYKVKS